MSRYHTQQGFTDVVGGLMATAGGFLIAAGWTIDPNGPIRGLLRRSSDSGATWSTVDDYRLDSARTLYQGVAEDSQGRLFALATQASAAQTGADTGKGMIRMSSDAGMTWADYLELQGADGIGATYSTIFIDSADQLFVSGRHGKAAVVQRLRLTSESLGAPKTPTAQ